MSEADRPNLDESGAIPGSKAGVRPIRKRGYHRALKRGESWAQLKKMMDDMGASLMRQMYSDMLKPSNLMGLLKK